MRRPFRDHAVKLPRIQRIRRGERVLCYHRPTGTRLPDLPESHPEFVAAWARAESQSPNFAPPVTAGTIAHAIRMLKGSTHWRGLSAVYRQGITRNLDAIAEAHGAVPLRGLRSRHIEADISNLDPNPANLRLKAWRLLLAHSGLDDDPSTGVRKRQTKTQGHTAWTREDVDACRNHWPIGTHQRAALELVAWTGARVSDAARLGRGNIGTDGLLTFRQAKTGGMAYVPWTSPLPSWARGWEAEREVVRDAVLGLAGFTLLETSYGKARSIKGLSNLISAAATAADRAGLTAHGLRKYRLTAIAEAGGSAHAIMSWGGHATLSEAEHYTRAANRRAMVLGTEQDQNDVNAGDMAVNARNTP